MRISSVLTALAAMMAAQVTATPVPVEEAVTAPEAHQTLEEVRPYDCDVNWINEMFTEMFHANCPAGIVDGKQTWKESSLNLNMCLMNDNGQLKWRHMGRAGRSCGKCVLTNGYSTDPIYSCFCDKPHDKPQWTSIHLREGLFNLDGKLYHNVS